MRKLHIGGTVKMEGWEVFNANSGSFVDHVGNAKDLSLFQDDTFALIYASHVLEHFDYKEELKKVLNEWKRVLTPGGCIYISVPDIDVLAQLIVMKDKLSFQERFFVMRMIFGGHVDQYDYHIVGLNLDFLAFFLNQAGFINIRRVQKFGIFNDTSNMLFKGVPISLNVIAEKPMIE